MPDLVGLDFVLDLDVYDVALPDFWNFRTGSSPAGCNPGAAIDAVRPPPSCFGITDPWADPPGGPDPLVALGYIAMPGGAPNRGRFLGAIQRNPSYPAALSSGTPYFAFRLAIDGAAAGEAGGPCPGCERGVTLMLSQITLHSPGGPEVTLSGSGLTSSCVTANGGACGDPVRRSTWGAIKALYRGPVAH